MLLFSILVLIILANSIRTKYSDNPTIKFLKKHRGLILTAYSVLVFSYFVLKNGFNVLTSTYIFFILIGIFYLIHDRNNKRENSRAIQKTLIKS